MIGDGGRSPEHIDVDRIAHTEASDNPLATALNVTVSVPDTIHIKIVEASALSDYEVWFFIASVIASAAIGFFVAFIQDGDLVLLVVTGVFGILFAIAIAMTISKRRLLRNKARDVPLRVSGTGPIT